MAKRKQRAPCCASKQFVRKWREREGREGNKNPHPHPKLHTIPSAEPRPTPRTPHTAPQVIWCSTLHRYGESKGKNDPFSRACPSQNTGICCICTFRRPEPNPRTQEPKRPRGTASSQPPPLTALASEFPSPFLPAEAFTPSHPSSHPPLLRSHALQVHALSNHHQCHHHHPNRTHNTDTDIQPTPSIPGTRTRRRRRARTRSPTPTRSR